MNWLLSESMLIFYMHSFRDAYWPDGKLAKGNPPRAEEEKLKTRLEAKEKVLQSIPGLFVCLFPSSWIPYSLV